MGGRAGDGGATAVAQAEPPAMERAEDFMVLNPAGAERTAGVGTAVEEDRHRIAVAQNGQTGAGGLDRPAPTLGHLVDPTQIGPLPHRNAPPSPLDSTPPPNLGLASEAACF